MTTQETGPDNPPALTHEGYALIFRASPHPMALFRLPRRIFVDVSSSWLEFFGLARGDVIGRPAVEVMEGEPGIRERVLALLEDLGSVRDIVATVTTASGRRPVVSLSLLPVVVDGARHLLTSIRDITESQTEHQALLRAQQVGRVGSLELEISTGAATLSTELRRLLGLGTLDGGTVEALLERVAAPDRDAVRQLFHPNSGRRPNVLEFQITTRAGTVRRLRARADVDCDEIGTPWRLVTTVQDITEIAQLREQKAERDRLATIGTATAMFAHEVGGPLNNMHMYAQLLERQVAKQSIDETLARNIGRLAAETRRLNAMLEEFRSVQRHHPLRLTATNLRQLLNDVVEIQVRPTAGPKIEVRCTTPGDLPDLHLDSAKMTQVLGNLCRNAVEAMPDGGVLSLEVKIAGDAVQLIVRDTGVGIAADVDPFQLFRSVKPNGTGLGLAICRQIVADHGGTITFVSEPGMGTTFTVLLPAGA